MIERLVEDYVALSAGMQFEAKQAFWDGDEPRPLLKPEEAAAPLIGWPAIHDYWRATRGALARLESRCHGIEVTGAGRDVSLAHFHLEWRAWVNGPFLAGAPLGAHVRVLAALRRRQDGWRIFCYVESHVDGVEFLRAQNAARSTHP